MSIDGRKTYGLALLAVLHAGVMWWTGEMPVDQALDQAWAGGVLAAVRHAMAKG